LTFRVPGDEGLVARRLDVAGDSSDGIVPGDVVPVIRPGAADFGHRQPVLVRDVVFEGDPFRAEAPAADGMIGIAFYVDHRSHGVLRSVAESVDDHSAGDCAIGTDASRLCGAGDLELADLGARFGEIEAESDRATDGGRYEEIAPRKFHEDLLR